VEGNVSLSFLWQKVHLVRRGAGNSDSLNIDAVEGQLERYKLGDGRAGIGGSGDFDMKLKLDAVDPDLYPVDDALKKCSHESWQGKRLACAGLRVVIRVAVGIVQLVGQGLFKLPSRSAGLRVQEGLCEIGSIGNYRFGRSGCSGRAWCLWPTSRGVGNKHLDLDIIDLKGDGTGIEIYR
jgi:hypothetical protein